MHAGRKTYQVGVTYTNPFEGFSAETIDANNEKKKPYPLLLMLYSTSVLFALLLYLTLIPSTPLGPQPRFWGQTKILSSLSPKRDCGTKGVNTAIPLWGRITRTLSSLTRKRDGGLEMVKRGLP